MSPAPAVSYVNNPSANDLLGRATARLLVARTIPHETGENCPACKAFEAVQWDIECAIREIDAGNLT